MFFCQKFHHRPFRVDGSDATLTKSAAGAQKLAYIPRGRSGGTTHGSLVYNTVRTPKQTRELYTRLLFQQKICLLLRHKTCLCFTREHVF